MEAMLKTAYFCTVLKVARFLLYYSIHIAVNTFLDKNGMLNSNTTIAAAAKK